MQQAKVKVMLTKYWQVFVLSLSEMFAWKINFVLWRVRVVLGFLLLYFLWSTVFLNQNFVFGYQKAEILTYILLVTFLRSLVLSSRSQDVAGEIRDGDLTNFLLRPVSYFGWWWTRDLVDKLVNIGFVLVELSLLYLLLRPPIFLQTNPALVSATLIVAALSLILYFYLSFFVSLAAFWIAEVWGIRFVTFIAIEFLSGGLFPLDILPNPAFTALSFTPFPYLLFFPAKIYLGQLPVFEIVKGFTILGVWIIFLIFLVNWLWLRGLRTYGGEGR